MRPIENQTNSQFERSSASLEAESDETLFVRCREGERDLLRILIERHHDRLLTFLYRLVGDRQAAEDVFQDAFLQAYLSAHTFDASRRFRPWLFTIAANKGRDYLRKRSRERARELSAPIGGAAASDGASFVDLLEIDFPDPSDGLDREERDGLVQRALGHLSPLLREVLVLAYFQKLSYQQIADQLGVPLGTVKSRLHAAVARFAGAWTEINEQNEAENNSSSSERGSA